ncbi:hypothetical protein CMI45_02965 [Candidatus Pacearchaeota archaeon]|nr:hypothetical protein [Candidatus Pacearchaeota archaeon]|tara:strand:- start:124 stop:615 length:492 start_codon:yes stop_codon:yes gene_type:complete
MRDEEGIKKVMMADLERSSLNGVKIVVGKQTTPYSRTGKIMNAVFIVPGKLSIDGFLIDLEKGTVFESDLIDSVGFNDLFNQRMERYNSHRINSPMGLGENCRDLPVFRYYYSFQGSRGESSNAQKLLIVNKVREILGHLKDYLSYDLENPSDCRKKIERSRS